MIPKRTFLARIPVCWVDKTCQANGTKKPPSLPELAVARRRRAHRTHYYYRVNNPEIMGKAEANEIPADRTVPRGRQKFGSRPEVMKAHFASGGELDKLLAAGRSNACRFFPTRAARLYVKPRHRPAVCLLILTRLPLRRAGDAALTEDELRSQYWDVVTNPQVVAAYK